MKLMMDASTKQIKSLRLQHGLEILQLRTPLTKYARDSFGDIKYGLDNGAYTEFKPRDFTRMAERAIEDDLCMWIAVPDFPGCAYSTIGMFNQWKNVIIGKRAFVLQDGIERYSSLIPWDEITAVFLGGSDDFKESLVALELMKEARSRGKWVHVGRVNTPRRMDFFEPYADSFDGSGIARFHRMKIAALNYLKQVDGTNQTMMERYE